MGMWTDLFAGIARSTEASHPEVYAPIKGVFRRGVYSRNKAEELGRQMGLALPQSKDEFERIQEVRRFLSGSEPSPRADRGSGPLPLKDLLFSMQDSEPRNIPPPAVSVDSLSQIFGPEMYRAQDRGIKDAILGLLTSEDAHQTMQEQINQKDYDRRTTRVGI